MHVTVYGPVNAIDWEKADGSAKGTMYQQDAYLHVGDKPFPIPFKYNCDGLHDGLDPTKEYRLSSDSFVTANGRLGLATFNLSLVDAETGAAVSAPPSLSQRATDAMLLAGDPKGSPDKPEAKK